MEKIVVGVDESEGAAGALRWAMDEARLHGWTVTAVLTWSLLAQHPERTGDGGNTPFDPGYDHRLAGETLASIVEHTLGAELARTIAQVVVNDLPADGLLDASTDARLLVLGARGLGGFRGLLLGSVTRKCLHHATGPVAVVRPDGPAPRASTGRTPRVVVGVDGSDPSRAALDWALDEARRRSATLDVVHAWTPPYLYGYPYTAPLDPTPYESAAREVVDAMLAEADTGGLNHPPHVLMGPGGGAAGLIIDAAAGADLVVIGSRGHGPVRAALTGSVSDQVAQHAPAPVIVTPSPRP